MAIEWAGLTDVGMRRDHNEDSLCVNPEYNLFIVCDGMGGHAAGEVASRIAVDTVEKFNLAPEEARKHPLRNVITRALGSKEDVIVDVMDEKLQDGDILLMCSDGLTGMLEDSEIRDLIEANKDDLDRACKVLIESANAHGG